jgi:Tol biopolymer transport system component
MLKFCARAAVIIVLVSVACLFVTRRLQSSTNMVAYQRALAPEYYDVLFVYDLNTGQSLQLETNTIKSAWSPDGSMLAYLVENGDETSFNVLNVENWTKRLYDGDIGRLGDGWNDFVWSPDSTRLLVLDSAGILYVLNLEDGSLNWLTAALISSYGWMHNGQGVYLYKDGETQVFNIETQAFATLVRGVNPHVSTDGRYITYTRDYSSYWLLDTLTSDLRQIFTSQEVWGIYGWSPNGYSLIASVYDDTAVESEQLKLLVLDVTTMSERILISDANFCAVDVTLDGRLAVLDTSRTLWLVGIESGTMVRAGFHDAKCLTLTLRPQKEM